MKELIEHEWILDPFVFFLVTLRKLVIGRVADKILSSNHSLPIVVIAVGVLFSSVVIVAAIGWAVRGGRPVSGL